MISLSLVSFVFITTFTPGPNNISSASMGIAYGYKRTLPFLLGIFSGFFIVMLICALLSGTLVKALPTVEDYLKLIGAAYIVWLAWGTLQADYSVEQSKKSRGEYKKGLFLQLLNPKVAVYGLTLYSTFLINASDNLPVLAVSAVTFAATAFCATSSWAVFGATISSFLKNDALRRTINRILALLLVYTAMDLSGLIELL